MTNQPKSRKEYFEQAASANKHLAQYRALLLNADFQPISYYPLSTVPWTQTFFWIAKGEERIRKGGKPIIHVVEEYDKVVHSANDEYRIPSVIAYTSMQPITENTSFSRFNLYLRDNFTCQYTGENFRDNVSELTLDHVIPQSKNGKNTWTNLVACSRRINTLKGDMSLSEFTEKHGYRLLKEPVPPSAYEIREKGKKYPPSYIHETWKNYLFWG